MADREQKTASLELIVAPAIEKRIFVIRERQVMLDEDLADLYGVETKRLIEQVKRNLERFPEDFMFQLRKDEAAALRSQIATSNAGRGGRRYAPYVFTEQGVDMLSSVLRSKRAIAVNIEIMRAFVELRRLAGSYAALGKRLEQIEREMGERLDDHDEQLAERRISKVEGGDHIPTIPVLKRILAVLDEDLLIWLISERKECVGAEGGMCWHHNGADMPEQARASQSADCVRDLFLFSAILGISGHLQNQLWDRQVIRVQVEDHFEHRAFDSCALLIG